MEGADTVAYWTLNEEDEAVIGDKDNYSYEYQGIKWAFASQQNMDLFVADPGGCSVHAIFQFN